MKAVRFDGSGGGAGADAPAGPGGALARGGGGAPGDEIAATQAFARDVLPLVAAGRVRPVVDEVFPFARAREAHERMERNASFGKLVLRF